MDRQITEQIVDNALLNDKEGFMSAFQAAMATKVADALEVKKVEVASNMLGAAEVAAQEDTLEEEVEQIDEGKNPYQLFADHPKFQEAHNAIDSAVKAGDVHAVVKAMSRYSHVGAQDSESRDNIFPRLKRRNKNVWYDYDEKNWHKRPKKEISEAEQIDEAKTKMTDAHKKIAKQVHRDLKSDEPVSQAYGFRVRQMHNLIRKKYGSNWRALAGINEEVEQIDEMEKDVSGPGRDGDGAHFGSRDKKPIKMTDKQRKESERMAAALSSAAMKHPKLKEDAEQIDEISKDLVDKYRNKAWNWVSKATNAPARYSDGRKTVAAQQAYLHKAAQKITKAAKRLKSMELADKKFSARRNATDVVPATSKYTK